MRIGVSITKNTMFRGKAQEFHNTYHFTLATAITAPSENIVDEITASEKKLHSLNVNFVRAQVWTAGGTKAQNQMIFQKPLSGVGSGPNASSLDRERAFLVQWKAGFDVNGKQVYLRKWYHSCGLPVGAPAFATGNLENTAELTQQMKDTVEGPANECREVGALEGWSLCAASGRTTTDPGKSHRYLEHHQLGEMWR